VKGTSGNGDSSHWCPAKRVCSIATRTIANVLGFDEVFLWTAVCNQCLAEGPAVAVRLLTDYKKDASRAYDCLYDELLGSKV